MCAECAVDPGHWSGDSDVAATRALRVVFATVLEQETAAACLGWDLEAAVALWPSSLYGLLAAAATRSRVVFCRCSRFVNARLGDVVAIFARSSSADIVERFVQGRELLSTRELAALLWVLVSRREAHLDFIVARLGAELEVAAARNSACPVTQVPAVWKANARALTPLPLPPSRPPERRTELRPLPAKLR
jgi:hypothetical protein